MINGKRFSLKAHPGVVLLSLHPILLYGLFPPSSFPESENVEVFPRLKRTPQSTGLLNCCVHVMLCSSLQSLTQPPFLKHNRNSKDTNVVKWSLDETIKAAVIFTFKKMGLRCQMKSIYLQLHLCVFFQLFLPLLKFEL